MSRDNNNNQHSCMFTAKIIKNPSIIQNKQEVLWLHDLCLVFQWDFGPLSESKVLVHYILSFLWLRQSLLKHGPLTCRHSPPDRNGASGTQTTESCMCTRTSHGGTCWTLTEGIPKIKKIPRHPKIKIIPAHPKIKSSQLRHSSPTSNSLKHSLR